MKTPRWLLFEAVIAIHQVLLAEHGGLPGIRDPALLDSALARPQNRFAYEPELSLFDLAASYGFGLIRNHPFADGNKRIALAATAVFLEINGWSLQAPEAETALMFETLAASGISETEFGRWIESHAVQAA